VRRTPQHSKGWLLLSRHRYGEPVRTGEDAILVKRGLAGVELDLVYRAGESVVARRVVG
jgi:hypothetical protein